MKNWILFAVFALCATWGMPTAAQGLQPYYAPDFSSEQDMVFDSEQKKLIVPFAGRDKEEGMLELFVAKNKFDADQNAANSPIADELNRISPAAGIQFTIDFSL